MSSMNFLSSFQSYQAYLPLALVATLIASCRCQPAGAILPEGLHHVKFGRVEHR